MQTQSSGNHESAFVLGFICVGMAKNNAAAKRTVNSSSAGGAVSTLIKWREQMAKRN